ncbi:hypothetical protein ACEPAI_4694 [Sanghuangporus weigelae]
MLARLQRSLASVPPRVTRYRFSTTARRANDDEDIDTVSQNKIDEALSWEKAAEKAEQPTVSSSDFAQLVASTSATPSPQQPMSPNGLSYAGLPDHKIFLDIPPAQDPLIRYLASSFLHDGRRHSAERRAARVLLHLHTLTRAEPLPLLRQAIEKVMPNVRVTRHKHSTKIIEIPVALNEKQQVRYAMKWMLKEAEIRGGRTIEERLAREIVLVLNGTSGALKQKDAQHTTAMVNRGNIPVGRAAL